MYLVPANKSPVHSENTNELLVSMQTTLKVQVYIQMEHEFW